VQQPGAALGLSGHCEVLAPLGAELEGPAHRHACGWLLSAKMAEAQRFTVNRAFVAHA